MTDTALPIDHESKDFIDWAFAKLDDEATYTAMITEAFERAERFYAQPKEIVLAQLKAKMLIGAIEHGAPTHTVAKVKEELNKEYADLLGWLLVEKWVEKKME
jgi:hypothetical protein